MLLFAFCIPGANATRFGRNKVQYRQFSWKILYTEHFDVYFYEGQRELADAGAHIVEQVNAKLENLLHHTLTDRIPVLLYASFNDFQQTNVTLGQVEEGLGGFTELFKNRVVVPFTGSYDELRHVLYHELTHVFMFDIVYGGLIESVIRQAALNPVPLWFVEGLAEYVSLGWDSTADMIMRDLAVGGQVVPLQYLSGGYILYKEGQSALNFIAERYGEEKIAEIVRGVAGLHNLDRALRRAIGLSTPELSLEWEAWLKGKYWPEVDKKEPAGDVARLVTDHRAAHSYLNMGPAISPDGKRVVFLSDRSGYADVYVVSALDGEILGKLVSGERSDEFEALHMLRTGFSWSPDGTKICFSTKSGESDAIHIVDAETGELLKSLRFDLAGIFTPAWSPAGDAIAFVGLKDGTSDLYMTDLAGATLHRLTNDFYDERDPAWSPDGRVIAFASDRERPKEIGFYRGYDLYALDSETCAITTIVRGTGVAKSPSYSPDGGSLAYVSDRDGGWDLYIADIADSTSVKLTDLMGGTTSVSWALGEDWLSLALYSDVGWDIAVVKEPFEWFAEVIESSDRFPSVCPDPAPSAEESGQALLPEPALDGPDAHGAEAGEQATADAASVRAGEQASPRVAEKPTEDPLSRVGHGAAGRPGAQASSANGIEEETSEEEGTSVARAREAYRSAVGARTGEVYEEEGEPVPGRVEDYKPRFSPDWITGGVSYTSGYGFGGTTRIAISDILGNHRFYVATDFFSSIESSNFYFLYDYLARRINYSVGVYNFKEYYYSDRTRLGEDLGERRYFTERNYGISAALAYPFSRFSRVELDVSALAMDRQFAEEVQGGGVEPTDEGLKRVLLLPSIRFVNDTTLWGYVGPIGGGRSSLVVSKAWELDQHDFEFLTVIADVRRYVRIGARHSLALRFVGARSGQKNAQNFYMGGVNTLRGYGDFDFSGTNMALLSLELRHPFIDRLDIASPIPLSLRGLRGVMFIDLGAAWDRDFRGVVDDGGARLSDIKAAFGFGVRMRLGFFIIRVDTGWPTDLHRTGSPRTHFALGAEF